MFFEESSRNPLIDSKPDILNKFQYSGFVPFGCLLNGFEEEFNKAFQRVLIHVIYDAERNAQEIQHGAFCCHWPIDLSLGVDVDLSCFCYL